MNPSERKLRRLYLAGRVFLFFFPVVVVGALAWSLVDARAGRAGDFIFDGVVACVYAVFWWRAVDDDARDYEQLGFWRGHLAAVTEQCDSVHALLAARARRVS